MYAEERQRQRQGRGESHRPQRSRTGRAAGSDRLYEP